MCRLHFIFLFLTEFTWLYSSTLCSDMALWCFCVRSRQSHHLNLFLHPKERKYSLEFKFTILPSGKFAWDFLQILQRYWYLAFVTEIYNKASWKNKNIAHFHHLDEYTLSIIKKSQITSRMFRYFIIKLIRIFNKPWWGLSSTFLQL